MQLLRTRRFIIRTTFGSTILPLAGLPWLIGLSSCAPGSSLPPLADTDSGPYRLAVDDQVRVITFGQEQLTGQFRVNDRGAIAVPLLGPIPATGLTSAELEHKIEDELRSKKVLLKS